VLAGPTAYAAATIAQAHGGGDPAAGPAGDGMTGGNVGTADAAIVDYLLANQGSARWIVAVDGSQAAAAIQLAAEQPVMSMGGFTGGDPTPTLEQLRADVAAGQLRYVLLGNGGGGPGGPGGFGVPGGAGGSASVSAWVTSACTTVTVDGSSLSALYDCAGAG
jgi:hypothetical protein